MNIGDKFQTAVFWATADQIILFAELVRPDYRGIADYPFTHVDKWQDVIRTQKQLQTLSYDDFPRGRMWYDNNSQTYHIAVGSRLINDGKLLAKLLKKFNITSNDRIVIVENAYY